MNHHIPVTWFAAVAAVVIAGCQPAQQSPHSVQLVLPRAGAKEVAPSILVRLRFSDPLLLSTVTPATVSLRSSGGPVPATLSVHLDDCEVQLKPLAPLSPAASYTVQVTGGVASRRGITLGAPFTSRFRTTALVASGARVLGTTHVPSAPSDRSWYARIDNPATPVNEAARDLAKAMAGGPQDEATLYRYLTGGGSLAVFASGAGHEQDASGRQSGWALAYARYVRGTLSLPIIQVDYMNWAAAKGGPRALATYLFSFREGVARTADLVRKARSAGVSEVRLFGHSKGGDVVAQVAWKLREDPVLTATLALGPPIWSAAVPSPAPGTRRGGLFRYDVHEYRDYHGELVVFVRSSDRSSHGEFFPVGSFPGPGHDYKNVLALPRFCDLLERTRFTRPVGYADRQSGRTYDF